MTVQHGTRNPRALEPATLLCCAGAFAIAVLALIGWGVGLPVLTNVLPGAQAMNPLTAVGILLACASLWMVRRPQVEPRLRRLAVACASLAAAIGAGRLLWPLASSDTAPDLFLFGSRLVQSPVPHRLGPLTAVGLLLIGSSLLSLDARRGEGWRPVAVLPYLGVIVPLVGLVGYVYGASSMHLGMAVNTATALLLLSSAALMSRPDRGLCRLLLSDSPGGVMARRVLPTALVVPIVLGWLRLQGQRLGFYGLEIGVALLTMTIVAVIVALIWATGRALDRADLERRRAEDALRRMAERQNLLLEANLIGVLTARLDGWIHDANPAFLKMIGYTREDLPLKADDITPPEWRGRSDVARQQIGAGGAATPFEKEYVRRDGTRVPVLVGAAALTDVEGEVMAFVVDLSGKRGAELEIERMRLFLDSIIENLPNMIFVKDAEELRFVRLNRAGEELLGLKRDAMIGKNDYDFFPREEADFFTAKDRAVLTSGELLDIPEETIQTGRGESRVLHTQKVPILDGEGRPRFLLGISEDITDRKAAEREMAALTQKIKHRSDELETANKELQAFSYSVSHDLRAPLRHIDGFADLLTRHAATALDEKGRRYLEVISSSAKSMGCLIDDLLAFSRMSRTGMHHSEVDLGRMISEVRQGLAPELNGRRVEWRIGPLPVVHGDPEMLRLAFVNLLANAVKYTSQRENAVIEVGTRDGPDEVVVFVRDNGVGFDMKYAHKLFGVFQRLHSAEEFEGTGIGLANVRRIIHRHGGRTWAEGAVDAGAAFYVTLPRTGQEHEIREAA